MAARCAVGSSLRASTCSVRLIRCSIALTWSTATTRFSTEANLHCDAEICIDLLRNCDFGFVHQVLTFSRERSGSLSEFSRMFNTYVAARLYELVKYGPDFLKSREYCTCRAKVVSEYYNYLAFNLLLGVRDEEFWNFHKQKLAEAGVDFSYGRLSVTVLAKCLRAVTHLPKTFEKSKLDDRGYFG